MPLRIWKFIEKSSKFQIIVMTRQVKKNILTVVLSWLFSPKVIWTQWGQMTQEALSFKDKSKSVISEKDDDKNWTEVYSKDTWNEKYDQIWT